MAKQSMAFKAEPIVKEGIEQLSICLEITQGDLIHKLVKEALQGNTYNRYLDKAINQIGLNFKGIIHDSATIEAEKIFNNLEEVKEAFAEIYGLDGYEQFEDIPIEQISISMIEDSDLYSDWSDYLEQTLVDRIVDQVNQLAVKDLKISGELLLLAKPELKMNIAIHAKSLINIYTQSHDLTMAYVIPIIPYLNDGGNSISPMGNISSLSDLIKGINQTEKRFIFTIYHSFNAHFRNRMPKLEKAVEFFREELNRKEFPIYDEIDVQVMISKILKSNPSHSYFS